MRVRLPLTIAAVALSIGVLAGCGGTSGTPVAANGANITASIVPGVPSGTSGATETAAGVDVGPTGADSGGGSADSGGGAASESSALPEPVTRSVGKTGWYDGFAITVDQATAESTSSGYVEVTVEATLKNLTKISNFPDKPDITTGGVVAEGFFDVPEVPAGGTAKATVTFSIVADDPSAAVDLDASLDTVLMTWGTPDDNQTIISLDTDAEVQSVEPIEVSASGKMQQDQIIVEVKGGTLVPSYESGEKGKALLTLQIALSCDSKCQAQGYNVNRPEFSLTGPDGQSVVADDRSDYCCTALYPQTTDDNANNTLTFVVPMPGTGDYTLKYENPYLTSEGTEPATLDFTA